MRFLLLICIIFVTQSALSENTKLSAEDLELLRYLGKQFPCSAADLEESCIENADLEDNIADDRLEVSRVDFGEFEVVSVSECYAYQCSDTLFLKQGEEYSPLLTLMMAEFDKKNLIAASRSKGRGIGDIGNVAFYKIDPVNKKLVLLKEFSTNLAPEEYNIEYVDENGKSDQEFGYDKRGEDYIKKMKWEFND